jgi:hypothetical protein
VRAARHHRFGPPEVLVFEETFEPHFGPGEIRIRTSVLSAWAPVPSTWSVVQAAAGGLAGSAAAVAPNALGEPDGRPKGLGAHPTVCGARTYPLTGMSTRIMSWNGAPPAGRSSCPGTARTELEPHSRPGIIRRQVLDDPQFEPAVSDSRALSRLCRLMGFHV